MVTAISSDGIYHKLHSPDAVEQAHHPLDRLSCAKINRHPISQRLFISYHGPRARARTVLEANWKKRAPCPPKFSAIFRIFISLSASPFSLCNSTLTVVNHVDPEPKLADPRGGEEREPSCQYTRRLEALARGLHESEKPTRHHWCCSRALGSRRSVDISQRRSSYRQSLEGWDLQCCAGHHFFLQSGSHCPPICKSSTYLGSHSLQRDKSTGMLKCSGFS